MIIECTVNGHTYRTEKLYVEDFKKLGTIAEEKIMPLNMVFGYGLAAGENDSCIAAAIYTASKDAFNRDDSIFLTNLVMNREHMTIDGKHLDNAEWEKHWQEVGSDTFREVARNFMEANLGNFTMQSALLPQEWTQTIRKLIDKKFSTLSESLNQL